MIFEKQRVVKWRRFVWRELVKLGFHPQRNFKELTAGMITIAVAHFGTDPSALSEITGSSQDSVKRVLKRLRKQKILVGQKMRVTAWDDDGFKGTLGLALDLMAAGGEITRTPSATRSAAQNARKPETYARGLTHSRRRRAVVPVGSVFTPQQVSVEPFFTLEEETRKRMDANGGKCVAPYD